MTVTDVTDLVTVYLFQHVSKEYNTTTQKEEYASTIAQKMLTTIRSYILIYFKIGNSNHLKFKDSKGIQ